MVLNTALVHTMLLPKTIHIGHTEVLHKLLNKKKKFPMCVCVCVLEIDEENPCAALRCLFLRGESPLHQRWGRFSNIKHHFQWRIIETAPVRYAACLAVILFGHRAAPKDVLKCSKNGPYIEKKQTNKQKLFGVLNFFSYFSSQILFFSALSKINK